jgi:hypothetical protein
MAMGPFIFGFVATAIIVVAFYISVKKPKDHFKGELIATSQRLNFENKFSNMVSIRPDEWDFVLNRLATNQPLSGYGNPTKIILDPIDYLENASYYESTQLDEGYFLIFTSPEKKEDFKCGFDFSGKTVGYFDNCEKKFIDTLTYGYRNVAKTSRIPIEKMTNLKTIWDSVDAVVIYAIPKSPLTTLIEGQHLVLMDVGDISIDRIHFTNPYLISTFVSKNQLFKENNKIEIVKETITALKMSLVLATLVSKESFISRLNLSPEFTDPSYVCVGNESISSKALCNSSFDIYGNPKEPSFTDKPCKKNEECPYYKANKRYPNDRGGCISGKCEMPVGVKRIGYTQYFDRGQYSPFCYGCNRDLDCCNTQKEPDFAFSNDKDDRRAHGLSTYNRI